MLASLLVASVFAGSRAGLMLRASREDEAAALASGIAVRRLRLAAFVLSAAVVGASGVLQGHAIGILSVSQFYLELTFLTLAMLVIGGQHSLSGAVIGAIVITLERHQKLTVITGAIVAVSAAAIVVGSALGAVAVLQPASATIPAPKFVSENNLPERIVDFQLPTI